MRLETVRRRWSPPRQNPIQPPSFATVRHASSSSSFSAASKHAKGDSPTASGPRRPVAPGKAQATTTARTHQAKATASPRQTARPAGPPPPRRRARPPRAPKPVPARPSASRRVRPQPITALWSQPRPGTVLCVRQTGLACTASDLKQGRLCAAQRNRAGMHSERPESDPHPKARILLLGLFFVSFCPVEVFYLSGLLLCFLWGKRKIETFEKKNETFSSQKKSDCFEPKNCEGAPPSTDAFACGLCRARLSLSGRGILMGFPWKIPCRGQQIGEAPVAAMS